MCFHTKTITGDYYIARVNATSDWLICVHVALDKCNVSRGATSKKLLPAAYIHKQNSGSTCKFINVFFQVYLKML